MTQVFRSRRHARRRRIGRDIKRGVMQARMNRLMRLFYEMTEDERHTYPSRAGARSMAAREVMVDALFELGSPRTADALKRLGSRNLSGTLLQEKIRRTIFGPPLSRALQHPHKPQKTIWLALVQRGNERRYIALDEEDILRGWSWRDGLPWLFEIGIGYSSLYKLVYADSEQDALEIAEERWPHLFLDELDEDDAAEAEERGEDVFNHPTKDVLVRRSDDVRMYRARAVVRARRIGDRYDRTAAILSRGGGPPVVVTYED